MLSTFLVSRVGGRKTNSGFLRARLSLCSQLPTPQETSIYTAHWSVQAHQNSADGSNSNKHKTKHRISREKKFRSSSKHSFVPSLYSPLLPARWPLSRSRTGSRIPAGSSARPGCLQWRWRRCQGAPCRRSARNSAAAWPAGTARWSSATRTPPGHRRSAAPEKKTA